MAKARWDKFRATVVDRPEPEPKMVRAYPLEIGVRRVGSSEECWTTLKSVRDAAKRLRLILKFCS